MTILGRAIIVLGIFIAWDYILDIIERIPEA